MTRGLILAALLALWCATPARADRALLIGAGAYPGLAPALRLAAPEEDARRLAAALTTAGFPADRITLMTAPAGNPPTRAAVRAALADLARTAVRGEQILVYFSGHGAQMPTTAPTLEPDGLDELYLMYDARAWDGGTQAVPGSLSDKDFAGALAAIRATGADVWFVADACHAGGLMRGAGDVRTKAVPMAALGIPARRRSPVVPTPPATTGAGEFAAFYAAAPGALAIERRLPAGSPDAQPWSQFSFALVRAIAAGRVRSLRDLALALEAADAGVGGDAPEPQFEGALDRPVLGLAADRPRRYPVARGKGGGEIAAGVEEGLAAGDSLRLYRAGEIEPFATTAVATSALGVARFAATLPPGAIEADRLFGAAPLASRQTALLAAIASLAGRGAAAGLQVRASVARPGAARRCAVTIATGDPFDPLALPVMGQCDVLSMTITNISEAAIDLSPLYVDAMGAVTGLGFVGGGSVRVAPGENRRVAIRALVEDRAGRALPIGIERVALVALPATTAQPRDLRGAATLRSASPALDDGAGVLVYRWRVAR